ncbi:hypothetical protein N1851_030768 [Merluccius polli]|uniref:Uncharacterized protein n=1 Tax=Merluccius polli TaxID=89951 RepID=A0AA47M4S6_MERPO|nr:hypothetical protein N1851_030768 [Merluccius polli]
MWLGSWHSPRRAPHTIDRLTIAGILALGPRQRVEVMEVRVLQVIENKVVQVQGTPVELKKFEVCDATGQTGLTVWDRLIMAVELGKCYTFSSLSTRKDGDRTVLTTTPSSVVTTTGQVGQPASISVMPVRGEETLRGPVTGVQIVAKPRCPRCHAGQEKLDVKLSTHRCERCSILQRHNGICNYLFWTAYCGWGRREERSMVLSNSAVFAFVRERFLSGSAHDGPALEETVIAIPEVEVTINAEGLVVRFAEATVQGGQGNTSRQSRRYFEATLQTGREAFNRVVCFSPEKRDEFVHAADNGQSVKLVGTRKSISYSNLGGFDVLVSSSSRLDVAGELAFPRRAPHTIDRPTIAGILALGPRQRVSVSLL